MSDRAAAAFWPHVEDERIASVRLRCHLVLRELQRGGADARLYRPGDAPPGALVLSKRYDPASLAHGRALRSSHGTRLVLDLCDNHFYLERDVEPFVQRTRDLVDAVRSVDAVVVASAALAQVVRQHVPEAPRIDVIGDLVEPRLQPPRRWRDRVMQRWRFVRWRRRLRATGVAPGRRLIWFGNHGSPNVQGGMSDLESVQAALHAHHQQQALCLTVISNSHERFLALTNSWAFPCLYLPWSSATFDDALSMHDIALIPVRVNPFTICKTANRVTTATVHGLAVAADAIPAYEEFAGCIVLNDWSGGLARLMSRADERAVVVERALARVEQYYAPSVIGARWAALLQLDRP